MFSGQYVLVPLTERKDLCLECIELLNQEWPRSIGARENTLRKSLNSRPPMSFVLVDRNTKKLVGHARLCPIPAISHSCWIESVIINSNLRGKGLGWWLMAKLEDEARKFGFRKAYLSSKNEQGFYAKCGYSICEPVLNAGANTSLLEKFDLGKFFTSAAFGGSINDRITQTNSSNFSSTSCTSTTSSEKSLPLPPPAPPPPPGPTSALLPSDEILKSGALQAVFRLY
ncbi:unnamed protein product [Litomosoides sigmodontis]|uniref:N-acetyltransferase domain-containing protein n=1 Tax=Litomosoides sigmodontis TaxID=42156 RepID=A0A3P6TY02_LITSI|nr:unnamed protein product [Litomosoides sigmodontis]